MNFRLLLSVAFITALTACGGAEERKAVYMEKAKSSIETGDLDKARIELKNVLQIDPKDGEAYYQLGKVYEQQKDYRKAYGSYLKAEELKPELLQNQARLGRFYLLLMNDSEKAQEKIDLILAKEPENSEGLLLKAFVLQSKKSTDDAIKLTKDIIKRDPAHIESVVFLTTIYVNDKKYSEAINVLDSALQSNQGNEQLSKLLATVLVRNKSYERAELIYKDLLEKYPDEVSSYNNLSAFYNLTDKNAKAEDILRASIDNDSDDEKRILTLIRFIKDTKGNDEAIKELKSYISINSRLGGLRLVLANLYIINKDLDSSVEVIKDAINDFSEEVTGITARTALASIYIDKKEFDKASKVIEDAYLISPSDPEVNYLRAKLAVYEKDLEKAIISLRIVTKEKPENVEASILLANVYQQEGDFEQAKAAINTAYENNKINADALLKLAQYNMTRDINQAEKMIDDFNALKGIDYEGLSIKAALLNQSKKQVEAYEIAETLMEAYPDKPNGYLVAVSYYNYQNDMQKAISVLEKGYLNTKDNRKILAMLTSLQVSENQFDVAIKRIKAELNASPKDSELKLLLAKVYISKKDIDSSESLLLEITDTDPSLEEPYLLLSQIYQVKKDIGSVKSILTKGKENVGSSLKIPLKLAAIYELEKDYKKAIDVYRSINQKHPDNLLVMNNLASMLSDYGNGKDDLEMAKSFIEKLKASGQPVFLDTIGWVYFKLGDYETAIQNLSQAVETEPAINVFNYHLGMAYKMSGDKAKAKVYLEKSLFDNKPFKEKGLAKAALKDL